VPVFEIVYHSYVNSLATDLHSQKGGCLMKLRWPQMIHVYLKNVYITQMNNIKQYKIKHLKLSTQNYFKIYHSHKCIY